LPEDLDFPDESFREDSCPQLGILSFIHINEVFYAIKKVLLRQKGEFPEITLEPFKF
jgi:hypothetical protein